MRRLSPAVVAVLVVLSLGTTSLPTLQHPRGDQPAGEDGPLTALPDTLLEPGIDLDGLLEDEGDRAQ